MSGARKKVKYERRQTSINQSVAQVIIDGLVSDSGAFAQAVEDSLGSMGKLIRKDSAFFAAMAESRPERLAQVALVFAILSPMNRIEYNVAQCAAVMQALDDGADWQETEPLYQLVIQHGKPTPTTGQNVRNLLASLPYIRRARPEDMNKPTLLALANADVLFGIAQKTSSMASAIFGADSDVFTLDVHMLRMICGFSGHPELIAGQMGITAPAYQMLEPVMVALCHKIAPNVAPFTIQWALWAHIAFGQFIAHSPMLGE